MGYKDYPLHINRWQDPILVFFFDEGTSCPSLLGALTAMKTLTESQIAAGILNDFIDAEQLEYFHLRSLQEVKSMMLFSVLFNII